MSNSNSHLSEKAALEMPAFHTQDLLFTNSLSEISPSTLFIMRLKAKARL